MGINIFSGSSISRSGEDEIKVRDNPNPDPRKYTVVRYVELYGNVVIELIYDGCTNYEGRKILVYENNTYTGLMAQGALDPHFSDDESVYSPIARFVPTDRGWVLAKRSCIPWTGESI